MSDVIDDHSAVGVAIVHRGQRLIALLASSIPDFKLDCGGIIEGDGLCQEGSSDSRLAIIIELVLTDGLAFHCSMYARLAAARSVTIVEDSL